MPNYRRDYSGSAWFFTLVTYRRHAVFAEASARDALRTAIRHCRMHYPFQIDARVLLPDHLHAIWTLPDSDRDYSRRWSIIKRRFTQQMGATKSGRGTEPSWQPRFWAHRIENETDFEHHVNHVHINPLKHDLVERVVDWPWSSFHRFVERGMYREDWGGTVCVPDSVGGE